MENREAVLKGLFPEDILKISSGLTDGEIEVLKQLVELLESKYRSGLNEAWVTESEPEGFFEDIGNLRYFDNPLLFEGREGKKTTSQLFQFFSLLPYHALMFP